MHILLKGGMGYIASHIAIVLMQMEHEVVCGVKKNMVRILQDIAASDPAWRIACLRYVSPVSAHDSGLISERPQGTPINLVPCVTKVAVGQLP